MITTIFRERGDDGLDSIPEKFYQATMNYLSRDLTNNQSDVPQPFKFFIKAHYVDLIPDPIRGVHRRKSRHHY